MLSAQAHRYTARLPTFLLFSLCCLPWSAVADIMEIYNTRLATSDLLWTKHSNGVEQGWEEVSSFDRNYQNTIRSYQVCRSDDDDSSDGLSMVTTDNWIRSPYISTRGGKRIHLDVEFSITKCSFNSAGKKSAKCKETFNLFYYEADSAVASSTFPPWHEKPYIKIDTVAANTVGGVNTKTFSFIPERSRNGFYIAVQDQGVCMSLISLRIYYFYCREENEQLAVFPRTISDAGSTSLVTVKGKCLSNAQPLLPEIEPVYRCSSDGRWQIPTGGCKCKAGFNPNIQLTECKPCPVGTYKLIAGSNQCVPCPMNSGVVGSSPTSTTAVDKTMFSLNQCPCYPGYARGLGESISAACTKPPSQQLSLNVTKSNATSASLVWLHPVQTGDKSNLFYSFDCKTRGVKNLDSASWWNCSDSVVFIAPSRGNKFYENYVMVTGLTPYTMYKLSVHAKNRASHAFKNQLSDSGVSQVVIQTAESAPSTVTEVRVTSPKPASVTVEWSPPKELNGIITGYEVELQPQHKNIPQVDGAPILAPVVKKTNKPFISLNNLDEGAGYLIRIRAKTSVGFGDFNQPSTFYTMSTSPTADEETSPESNNLIVIIAVAVGGFVLVGLLLFVAVKLRRNGMLTCPNTSSAERKKNSTAIPNGAAYGDRMSRERLIVDLPPSNQRIYVDYADPQAAIDGLDQEINAKYIEVGDVVGEGEFAEVCRGKLLKNSTQINVAVKRLKSGATQKDQINFLREACTIAQFNNANIVQLKGVVTKSNPRMIVTEFMENGSLDRYLKLHAGHFTIIQLLTMLRGIASGMRYLSSIKYVHRDLAARNILVDSSFNCKVSDFGLSRTLENDPHATYTTQGGKIAIRWTALECILYREFTSASDVWSYGIVMWEVMSYGEKPYWDMSNEDVVKNLQQGMRLPSPMGCPEALHDTMLDCWAVDTSARPTFVELVKRVDTFIKQPELLRSERRDPHQHSNLELGASNMSRATSNGDIENVDQWLEMQKLSKYKDHFRQRGINNLDKLSNLTINDLKSFGIDVTLHINELESGIRSLRHHLSTAGCTPRSSMGESSTSSVFHEENEVPSTTQNNRIV